MGSTRLVLLGLAVGLGFGCGGEEPKETSPAKGSEGAECRPDGSCDAGLVCASSFCVAPPEEDAALGDDTGTDVGAVPDTSAVDVGDVGDVGAIPDVGPDLSGTAPTCVITLPSADQQLPFSEMFSFAATASDAEDGALTGASVSWSSGLAGALGTGETLQLTLEPPGLHVITCTATDSDGMTGTATVQVTSLSPYAEIWHPGDGETRPAANAIPFTGRGFDYEDGALPGSVLVWTSNLDQSFGTGEDFSAQLSAGDQTVTLTVSDSDGNTATDVISLTITP